MKLYVSKNLLNLLNHVKTENYNTKKGISLKAIAVYIIYKSLSIFLDLWKGRNFEGRGVSCIFNK